MPATPLAFSNPCDDVPTTPLTFSTPCDDVPENPVIPAPLPQPSLLGWGC
jgi:hypothetical protein